MSFENLVELGLNKKLIDPDFDGYKLSLDSPPIYKIPILDGIDETSLTEDQYSYQHIKAFGIHNYLFQDPWNFDHVYFISSSWDIYHYFPANGEETDIVFKIPDVSNQQLVPARHSATLCFLDEKLAVVADGAGKLHLVETGTRQNNSKWKVLYTGQVLEEGKCFILLHAVLHIDGESQQVECLLLHVDKQEETEAPPTGDGVEGKKNISPAFCTSLEWLTLTLESDGSWKESRRRKLTSSSSPDYASIEPRGTAIVTVSEKPFKFVSDSLVPVQETSKETKTKNEQGPLYTWTQNESDIVIHFTLPENVTKSQINFKLKAETINLSIREGPVFLSGALHDRVDVEASTWTLSDRRLEVHLSKSEEGRTWPVVVKGDTRGELVYDEEQVAKIHEQLAHLTSESWGANGDSEMKPAYNVQELEECDDMEEASNTITRLDANTHQITHQVNLGGHQWLFQVQLEPNQLPAVCLRHDVDGLLWQPCGDPEPGKSPWNHIGTFNALGYVQASKTQKKFAGCSINQSFAAICDCARHVYIYRQPTALLEPLRHRKSGRTVSAVAKQQLVSFQTAEQLLGMQISASRIFILTQSTLYVVAVDQS